MPDSINRRTLFKQQVMRSAIQAGYLGGERVIAAFIDTDGVAQTIKSLQQAFADHFQHMFAAKANSMRRALLLVKDLGMGCEVASHTELEQALRAGFGPDKIVYDDPAKTKSVIQRTLAKGISLNIDNFQEFEVVRSLMNESTSHSPLGFRINPQIGAGSIGAMSTATESSKFGVTLNDQGNRSKLIECYKNNPWLNSIHTHIGSQGCALELMINGIRKVVDLVEGINAAAGRQQVRLINIGGGLPVNFDSEETSPAFDDYAAQLKLKIPELFSGKFMVRTEFGRSIFAKNGFIAARVEYTKQSGGRQIAISHAGAQTATRTTFMPEHWVIRLGVYDPSGQLKTGHEANQDVAGPCCFAGDMLAYQRDLPRIEAGDYIMLHDTGAYYFSNPFYYNSLPAAAVYGAQLRDDGSVGFDTWRKQQTLDEVLAVIG